MIVSQGLTVSLPVISVTPSERHVLNTIPAPGCWQFAGSACAHATRAPPRSIIAAASSGSARRAAPLRDILPLKKLVITIFPQLTCSGTTSLGPGRVRLLAPACKPCNSSRARLSRRFVVGKTLRGAERGVCCRLDRRRCLRLTMYPRRRLRVDPDSPALGILGMRAVPQLTGDRKPSSHAMAGARVRAALRVDLRALARISHQANRSLLNG